MLRFLLLGALLWAADAALARVGFRSGGRPEIVIGAAECQRIRDAWIRVHGAPPSPTDERSEIDRALEEEILYREAIARGLDRGDPSVRGRLVAIMRFLGAPAGADDETLYRQALSLGLEASEPAIHRHLALQMRLLASLPPGPEAIDDANLERALRAKAELFRKSARVTFVQVFFSTTSRGAAAEADARRALERLGSADAPAGGDAFPLGSRFTRAADATVESSFGGPFATALDAAPLGRWAGPIQSVFGWHIVRVEERLPAATAALEEARARLLEIVRRERGEARYRDAYQRLRARYAVRVDDAEAPSAPGTAPAFERLVPRDAEALE